MVYLLRLCEIFSALDIFASLFDWWSLQVRGAISAIRYTEQFPRLPADFEISGQRDLDMFDLLEYVFGFQVFFNSIQPLSLVNTSS